VGTRFLIRHMNAMDREYPFIDNIKPFSLFLRLFAASGVTQWNGPLKVLVGVFGMLSYLTKTTLTRPSDFLSKGAKDAGSPVARLVTAYTGLSKAGRAAVDQEIARRGYQMRGRPLDYVLKDPLEAPALLVFLADHMDLLDDLEPPAGSTLGAGPGTLSLGPAFFADETAELKKAAKKTLSESIAPACIVMGHTHEVVNDAASPRYFNTGSWTRYYDLRKHGKLPAWNTLRSKSYNVFPYQLNYLEAARDSAGQMSFAFRTWAESGS
jgi:hypothetical protein